MAKQAASILGQLEHLKDTYGGDTGRRKLELLRTVSRTPLGHAREVARLHEVLCFLRAYPDTKEVLAQVEQMLEAFDCRRDLKRYRKALTNSGIAGTDIHFAFYWFTAHWLALLWPDRIAIDWKDFDKKNELRDMLHLLVPFSETPALDELSFSPRQWIDRLKAPNETDAYFLMRRFGALAADSFGRETFYERLDIPIKLMPGADTPSRTRAVYPVTRVAFQTRPFTKVRAPFRREIWRGTIRISILPPREGRRLIHLAREAMIVRSRDLDAFEHASEHDVRLVDCGRGLQFACLGVVPERRLLLEAVYSFLTLKNGVPIGYLLVSSLFRSSGVAFNIFETYRSAESRFIYGRTIAMVRKIFGSDTISVPPYQLGHNNPEALQSGAWWFYYKLGFRSHDPEVRRIVRRELGRVRRRPRYRTDLKTLNKLASQDMYLYLGPRRSDIMGQIPIGEIGLRIIRTMADRFGADREKGLRTCSLEAARLLGLRSFRGFSPAEKLAWERWSPLIMALEGIEAWSPKDKRGLIGVVQAKGGRRESRFVHLFDRHRPLRKAILNLAEA